jgi:crotonobetaine/carnitine-CoA ligase
VNNLAELLLQRSRSCPTAEIGTAGGCRSLADFIDVAQRAASVLLEAGVGPGTRVALVGQTSTDYLLVWAALHLVGAEAALVNPTYPVALLAEMFRDLEPRVVIWSGTTAEPAVAPAALHADASKVGDGSLTINGNAIDLVDVSPMADLPGLHRRALDVACFMHTSGTTGAPKFCAQSHEYFLRLGRFIADSLCLSTADTVLAPLPMFHINPLGYGVIGALTAGASIVGAARFSASGFWSTVREVGATALILHAPPVEILKRATTMEDAAGHKVRVAFFGDPDFLTQFDIPLGVSVYGSTEAGGLSHLHLWRRFEQSEGVEASRLGGRARDDIEWRVSDAGEIMLRPKHAGVMFSGYQKAEHKVSPFEPDGWFATGDIGRVDPNGELVFVERRSESIRVKGEYVPIAFVEEQFSAIGQLQDLAVWRRTSDLVDDEVLLYVVCDDVPLDDIRRVAATMPQFMRPSTVVRVGVVPRDAGVGKVRRAWLTSVEPLGEHAL